MKILFRVDANDQIGFGHFYRCLSIGLNLYKQNNTILFIGQFNEFIVNELIKNKIGFIKSTDKDEIDLLSNAIAEFNPDEIFIDKLHQYTKKNIEYLKKKTCASFIMMHNLCEGAFYVDIFILPSEHHSEEIIKNKLWDNNKFFHGADYVIINSKIQLLPKKIYPENKVAKKICITTGGSDPKGVMLALLTYINKLNLKNLQIDVLVGNSFVYKDKLTSISKKLKTQINITNFCHKKLIEADLAIATFGVTTYELLYIGVPVLSVGHAIPNANGSYIFEKKGLVKNLGLIDDLTLNKFTHIFTELIKDSYLLKKMSDKGKELVDGKAVERISELILKKQKK